MIVSNPYNQKVQFFANTAFEFDGFNERMQTAGNVLDITGQMWVYFRIKTTSTDSLNCQICKDTTGGTQRSWNAYWRGSGSGLRQLFFTYWDSTGAANTVASTANVLDDGNWHDILITITGTTAANGIKMYRDGSLDGQATAANSGVRNYTGTYSDICIGSTSGSSGGWFNRGRINSPAVGYGYLPDATDAANLYAGTITPVDLGAEFVPDFDNATHDGSNWNVPAFSGGAAFTSEYMESGDRYADAP